MKLDYWWWEHPFSNKEKKEKGEKEKPTKNVGNQLVKLCKLLYVNFLLNVKTMFQTETYIVT